MRDLLELAQGCTVETLEEVQKRIFVAAYKTGLPNMQLDAIFRAIKESTGTPLEFIRSDWRAFCHAQRKESNRKTNAKLLGLLEQTEGRTEEEARQMLLNGASEALTVEVSRVLRYSSEPPSWEVVVNGTRIVFKAIQELTEQRMFQRKLAETLAFLPPTRPSNIWEEVVNCLLKAAEVVPLNEVSEFKELEKWIGDHVEKAVRDTDRDYAMAIRGGQPLCVNERYWVNLSNLRRFIKDAHGVLATTRDLATLLKRFGSVSKQFHKRDEHLGRVYKEYWAVPEGMLLEPDAEFEQEVIL